MLQFFSILATLGSTQLGKTMVVDCLVIGKIVKTVSTLFQIKNSILMSDRCHFSGMIINMNSQRNHILL